MAPSSENAIRQRLTREAALLTGLLFVGIVLLPVAIWVIGSAIFGEYAGQGFGDFFGSLTLRLRAADRATWFLVLSPYLGILTLRLMVWGWRRTAERTA